MTVPTKPATFATEARIAGAANRVSAPGEAFSFTAAGSLAAKGSGAKQKPTRDANGHYRFAVQLLARSPEPINHWYWGRIAHELSGVRLNGDRVALDWMHRSDETCGSGAIRVDSDGLWVEGEVLSFSPQDVGDQIVDRLVAGVPLEASIQFDMENGCVVEWIAKNMSVICNGKSLEGEAVVFRQWMLRRVAICASGYDPGTRTKALSDAFHFGPRDVAITRLSQPATEPEKKPMSKTEEANAGEPADASKPEEKSPEKAAPKFAVDVLDRFVDRFGAENGVKWLREGLSFEQALERHVGLLQERLTAAEKKNADLAEANKAVNLGHDKPATFSTDEKKDEQAAPAAGTTDGFETYAKHVVENVKK